MEEEKRTYKHSKLTVLPTKYKTGWMSTIDQRTELFRELQKSYNEITTDLGGEERLSHIQLCLIERFVFLQLILRIREQKFFAAKAKKQNALFRSWLRTVGSLTSLATKIGIKREAKQVTNLQDYVDGRVKKSKKKR